MYITKFRFIITHYTYLGILIFAAGKKSWNSRSSLYFKNFSKSLKLIKIFAAINKIFLTQFPYQSEFLSFS